MSRVRPTIVEPGRPAAPDFLTVWSRSRLGEWLIERSYAAQYVRNVLQIPAGSGRVGEDGRYYIALPQGVHPSPLVAHPADIEQARRDWDRGPLGWERAS